MFTLNVFSEEKEKTIDVMRMLSDEHLKELTAGWKISHKALVIYHFKSWLIKVKPSLDASLDSPQSPEPPRSTSIPPCLCPMMMKIFCLIKNSLGK